VIVPDWLERQAAVRPDHPALVTAAGSLGFRALEARVALLARRLRAAGIGPGARVGALLGNEIPLVELVHAVPRAGAALVLLDPRLSPAEVAQQAAQARVQLVVAGAASEPAGRAAAAASGARLIAVDALDKGAPVGAEPAPPVLDLDAPHTVVFTSGTAGTPKGVVLTAGNHLWSALGSAARLGAHRDDRWLACLPLTHVGGLSIVLRGAITGTTVVLHDHFEAGAVARALAVDGVTLVSLVPTALARLLPLLGAAPALRCVLVGGAAADPELLAAARARGLPLAPTYGLTEAASQVATAAPGDAGLLPLLHTSVRIRGAGGRSVAPGEAGEIQVCGPTVSPGHLAADGTLRAIATDGWLCTGDRGRLGPDGALTVLGRADDVIVTGGENVDPEEVEAALLRHPEVAEAAVAGVADPEWGQAVAAWVVPRAGAHPTLDALRAAARDHLASYKLPRHLIVVDSLPRTATGKVRRVALRTSR
jgi:O-succinylbenzoic acid--CoA ligase